MVSFAPRLAAADPFAKLLSAAIFSSTAWGCKPKRWSEEKASSACSTAAAEAVFPSREIRIKMFPRAVASWPKVASDADATQQTAHRPVSTLSGEAWRVAIRKFHGIQYSNRSRSGASNSNVFRNIGTPSKDRVRTGAEFVKLWYNSISQCDMWTNRASETMFALGSDR